MEKSKRVSLGVQKKNKSTKQNKKKLFTNVLDYLKSDTYMFAPLCSHSPSASGTRLKEPIKENKKRMLKMVGDYMKSDTYMYSPLLSSHLTPSPPQEKQPPLKVTFEVTTTTLNTESANAIAEKQPCEDSRPGLSVAENQTIGHRETVKHMVYQRCCQHLRQERQPRMCS